MNTHRPEDAYRADDPYRTERVYPTQSGQRAVEVHRTERAGRRAPAAALPLIAGVGIGAALMYFLEPGSGTRRRTMVRDQAGSAIRTGRRQFQRRAEDLRHRAAGALAEARARWQDEELDDEQLVARVRSQLGHHVRHARPVEVTALGGVVTLRGPVQRSELSDLLRTVQSVRGVERVNSELIVHDAPTGAPALQH